MISSGSVSSSSSGPGCSTSHPFPLVSSHETSGHLDSYGPQTASQAFFEDSGSHWREFYEVPSHHTPEASSLTAAEPDDLSTRRQRSLSQAVKRWSMVFTPTPGKVRPFLTSLDCITPPKPRGSFHVQRHSRRPSPGPTGRIGSVAINSTSEEWDEDALSDAYSSHAAYSDEEEDEKEDEEDSGPFLGILVHSSDTGALEVASTTGETSTEATLEFNSDQFIRRYKSHWSVEESVLRKDDAPHHGEGAEIVDRSLLTICPLLLIPSEETEETGEENEYDDEDDDDDDDDEDAPLGITILYNDIAVREGDSLAIGPSETLHLELSCEVLGSTDVPAPVPATILNAASETTPEVDTTPDAVPNTAEEAASERAQEIVPDATPAIATGSVALPDLPRILTPSKENRRRTPETSIPNPLPPSPDISIINGRKQPKVCGFKDCVVCYPTAANARNLPLHPRGRPIWCRWCDKVFPDRSTHQRHLSNAPHWLQKDGIALMEKDEKNKVQCRWPGCTDRLGTDSSSLKKHTTRHTQAAMRHNLCGMWVSNTSTLARHIAKTCPILHGGEKNKSGGGAARRASVANAEDDVEFVEGDDGYGDDEDDDEDIAEENDPAPASKAVGGWETRGQPKGRGRAAGGRGRAAAGRGRAAAGGKSVSGSTAAAAPKKRGRPAGSAKRVREPEDDDDDPDDSDYSDSKSDCASSPVAPRRGAKRRRC